MKKIISYVLAASMLVQGCAGRTNITSQPSGAKVFIDGNQVGQTPYQYSDKKIIGSTTNIRLEKPGYKTFETSFTRDEELHVGALIGGLFLFPVLLWVTTYKDNHNYTLEPEGAQAPPAPAPAPQAAPTPAPQASPAPATEPSPSTPAAPQAAPVQPAVKSKAERLRELNALKEQKLISDKEYDVQRQKILDEP